MEGIKWPTNNKHAHMGTWYVTEVAMETHEQNMDQNIDY